MTECGKQAETGGSTDHEPSWPIIEGTWWQNSQRLVRDHRLLETALVGRANQRVRLTLLYFTLCSLSQCTSILYNMMSKHSIVLYPVTMQNIPRNKINVALLGIDIFDIHLIQSVIIHACFFVYRFSMTLQSTLYCPAVHSDTQMLAARGIRGRLAVQINQNGNALTRVPCRCFLGIDLSQPVSGRAAITFLLGLPSIDSATTVHHIHLPSLSPALSSF